MRCGMLRICLGMTLADDFRLFAYANVEIHRHPENIDELADDNDGEGNTGSTQPPAVPNIPDHLSNGQR